MSTPFHTLLDRLDRTNQPLRLASVRGNRFFSFPSSRDEAAQVIADMQDEHLWFEINESSHRGTDGRSKAADITRLNALYIDIDFKTAGMGSQAGGHQILDDLVAALGVVPAAIVHSGNGIQAYWPISDARIDDDTRETVAIVLARWKEMAQTFARAAGGEVDSVFDLPRIFRVPGSNNVKDPANPKPVTVDFPDGWQSFTIDELLEVFDDYGIHADPREIPSEIVAPIGDWEWADEDCKHVSRIREEWAKAEPTSRHHWLLAQSAVMHGMIRYGCVTEDTLGSLYSELEHRFQQITAADAGTRAAPHDEVPSAYRWGAQQAAYWSKEKLIDEMRGHQHDDFIAQLTRGATTLAAGPIAQAPARDASVIDLFTKRDVSARPADGGTASSFGALALVSANAQSRLSTVAHTDTGNAELFAQDVAGRFAYVSGIGWYNWTGQRWQEDIGNLHREAYKDLMTTRLISETDPQEIAWLNNSLNAGRLNAAIRLSESTEAVRVHPNEMDTNMRELVTPNGIVNLMDGTIRPVNPLVDRHTKMTKMAPDFSGRPEAFIRFLTWAFHGNQRMVDYMQRLLGLALIGELRVQIFPILVGAGANGKSTLFDILMDILGDYVIKMPPSFLVLQKGTQIPEALASTKGTRMALASEVPANATFDEELVKSISGDAFITARKLFENSSGFHNTTTLFGAFNHAPSVTIGGTSWWRRIRQINMTAYLPDEKQDVMLRQKLVAEEGGKIFAWLLQGTAEFLRVGEARPAEVLAATQQYRLSEDDMARFIDTDLERFDDVLLPRQTLYQRYVQFMQTNRLFKSMLSEPKFIREFLVLHPEARIVVNGTEDEVNIRGFRLKGGNHAPAFPFDTGR